MVPSMHLSRNPPRAALLSRGCRLPGLNVATGLRELNIYSYYAIYLKVSKGRVFLFFVLFFGCFLDRFYFLERL